MERKIYLTYGSDAKAMTLELMEAAKVNARIPEGASVALKPNLVVARAPEGGATTHAGVLEGIIEYLQSFGRKEISIIEGSWVGDSTPRGFRACGYDEIGKRFNVPLYDLQKDSAVKVQTKIGPMQICERALNTDYLINLPVLKGHCQTTMTCALKNCKGCIPNSEKRRFHTMGRHDPIAALAAFLKPALTVVDSICGDLKFEEGGNPVETNRIYLGDDMVQLDAFGCSLMGIDTDDVDYIARAERYGAGKAAFSEKDIITVGEPANAPVAARHSGIAARLGRFVQQKDACSACYGNLIHALYRMDEEGFYLGAEPIFIGQGYQGLQLDGVGIGRCCSGGTRCAMGCPPSANEIRRVLEEIY